MSREVVVRMMDDLDKTVEADTTVTFAYEGWEYTLDLTNANKAKFDKSLKQWIEAAHERKRTRRPRKAETDNKETNRLIRQWAKENGFEVATRGYIAAEVREAYEAAHG